MTTRFDAILFDLGGVIIDLDWSRTTNGFLNLVPPSGRPAAERALADVFLHPALHEYERGEIPWESFRQRFSSDFGLAASEAEFLTAWNAMILEVPQARLVRMAELRTRYRLGILSNTNERHVDFVNAYLVGAHRVPTLDSLVDVPLYSHLVGMRKPEARIYHHAAKALAVEPHRILFIDDNRDNAAAATAAGLTGCYLDLARESVLDVLKDL